MTSCLAFRNGSTICPAVMPDERQPRDSLIQQNKRFPRKVKETPYLSRELLFPPSLSKPPLFDSLIDVVRGGCPPQTACVDYSSKPSLVDRLLPLCTRTPGKGTGTSRKSLGSIPPPFHLLRSFTKLEIHPDRNQTLQLLLTCEEGYSYYSHSGKRFQSKRPEGMHNSMPNDNVNWKGTKKLMIIVDAEVGGVVTPWLPS